MMDYMFCIPIWFFLILTHSKYLKKYEFKFRD